MSEPITFESATPRFGLPNLFPGQAQKEFFVNEAWARLDAILHPVVEEETATPPTAPAAGQAWLVASGATGAWSGRDGQLAAWQAGGWVFVLPVEGMRLIDRATGGSLAFIGSWQRLVAPAAPSGGTTIDHEARAAIVSLVATLGSAGILPAS